MKRKYQEGGWMTGMMKSRMATAAALGNPSAKRMTQLHPLMYTFDGTEGTDVPAGETGTHYMASMGEYAVPFIQERNGKLIYNKKASFRDKEAMRFNSPEEAEYFAEHYKEVAPMMREYQQGGISQEGYKRNSPDRNNDFNIIPSGRITMKNVPHPVMGIDNTGYRQVMQPGGEYQFPGSAVYELPIKNNSMKKMQQGGKPSRYELIHEDKNGNKFTLYKGTEPLDREQSDFLVERSRAMPYRNQATGDVIPRHPLWYVPPPSHPIPGMATASYGGPEMPVENPIAYVPTKKNGGYSGTYSNGVYFRNGGPTYMPGGAGPMFMQGGYVHPFAMNPGPGTGSGMLQEYASETMQNGGNTRVNPFAMYPGTGMGSGMLQEYANEQMRMGGKPCLECGSKAMQQGGVPPGSTPYAQNYGPYQSLYGKEVSYPGDTLTDNQLQALAASRMMERHMGNVVTMMGPDGKPYNYQMSEKDMQKLPKADKRGKLAKFMGQGEYERYLPAPQHQAGGQVMMEDTEQDTDEMKSGGWIQGAVNPAHKGYCTPMTKSTCTPRRKAFAMTMKKHHGFHHKEYGGEVTQGGNLVRDNEMYAWGGAFHPLAKFMQQGGQMNLPADPNQPDPWQQTPGNYDPGTDPNNPVNNPPPMPRQGGYEAAQGPAYEGNMDDQQQDDQAGEPTTDGPVDNRKQRRGIGWGIAGAGLAAMGAGLGIASYFANQRDARNLRNKNFNDRMTSNAFAAQNGPGSMGDYDQYGTFRPNQNTPTKPGAFYPKTSQYGGTFAMGGSYQNGGEYEMSDAEIARLRKMGYKIDIL